MNKFKIKSFVSIIIIAIAFFAYGFSLLHLETREGDATIIKTGNHYFKLDFVGESGIKHPVYDISLSEKETKKNIQVNKTNEETLLDFQRNIVLIKSMKITSIFTGFIFIIITAFMIAVIYDKQLNLSKVQRNSLLVFVLFFLLLCTWLSIHKLSEIKKLESDLVVYYNSL
ncbi:hypothetical protein [Clostridium fungisolvens]|uniref:Uncharacterized protein n=1 Tax=Clostridium fungisolvens TaxID=1604897 RepID=A0A6V8SDI6_9CLOT|nr:hypothetical protein [Clostridium fungisolvens]GFP75130.1 hypothetical protein bsdtw1_01201 [Clostridium fungisolvens]